MNRNKEEIYYLEKALELEPLMTHALVNLAGYNKINSVYLCMFYMHVSIYVFVF